MHLAAVLQGSVALLPPEAVERPEPQGFSQAEGERYRLNDFRWKDFWVTEEEFERACRDAVSDFSIARAWLDVW